MQQPYVVIVDDDGPAARYVQDMIEVAGVASIVETIQELLDPDQKVTPTTVIPLLDALRPDVVIMDVNLDEGTKGTEIIERLQGQIRCAWVLHFSEWQYPDIQGWATRVGVVYGACKFAKNLPDLVAAAATELS